MWPTLCPSVWPERTQMEAHSVLAAPHTVQRCGVHSGQQTELSYIIAAETLQHLIIGNIPKKYPGNNHKTIILCSFIIIKAVLNLMMP